MNQKNKYTEIAFPCLTSHIEALENYSATTGADRDLVVATMILEELDRLNDEPIYVGLHALRNFKIPSNETTCMIHRRVLEHIEDVAEVYGLEVPRLIAWCVMERTENIRVGIRDFHLACQSMSGLSWQAKELPNIAKASVELAVALSRPEPSLRVTKNETSHSYDTISDHYVLGNHEMKFFDDEDASKLRREKRGILIES